MDVPIEAAADPLADEPIAIVLDSEPTIFRAIREIGRRRGIQAHYCDSIDAAARAYDAARAGCVFVDPEACLDQGLSAPAALARRQIDWPVIIVSATAEVRAVVGAIRAGAINYLRKPCHRRALCEALDEAVRESRASRLQARDRGRVRRRLDQLTPGERSVLDLLLQGLSNRQIAAELRLSLRAVEARRSKLKTKMRVRSAIHLFGQVLGLGEAPAPSAAAAPR